MANSKKHASTTKKAHVIYCYQCFRGICAKSVIPQIVAEKFKTSPYRWTCHIFCAPATVKETSGLQSTRGNIRVGSWKQIWQLWLTKREVTSKISIYSAACISLILNFTADSAWNSAPQLPRSKLYMRFLQQFRQSVHNAFGALDISPLSYRNYSKLVHRSFKHFKNYQYHYQPSVSQHIACQLNYFCTL